MKSFRLAKKKQQRRPVSVSQITGLLDKPKLPITVIWKVHEVRGQSEFVFRS